MADDLNKKVADLEKKVEQRCEGLGRELSREQSWEMIHNALGMVKLSQDHYASTRTHLIEEAADILERVSKNRSPSQRLSHHGMMLHISFALRAMTMSPGDQQKFYQKLGESLISDHYS